MKLDYKIIQIRRYLFLLFFLPFFSFAQECTTVIPNNNADSIVYCVTNTTCYDTCDGVISITVYGANHPYSFEWFNSSTPWVGVSIQDTLCPGPQIITIRDLNGNLVDNSHINIVNGPPNFSVFTNTQNNPTCFNYNDGSIDLTINGATPFDPDGIPNTGDEYYNYLWEDGTSTEDRTSLDSGLYIISMTDANGCNRIDSFELFNPDKVNSITITDTLSCIGMCDGDAIVIPLDGISPYTFEWNDINSQTNDTAINLCYGVNIVYITDSMGCLDTNEVFIENPDTLKLSNITIDDACYQACDGQLSLTIQGGYAPYSKSWNFGGIEFNNVDTITTDTLCPGLYQFIFSDANNCIDTVDILLMERDSFVVNRWIINDSCYNSCTGQITVELQNQDNPPFTYIWQNGGSDTVISNLCSDSLSLEIIDGRQCRDTFYYFVDQPDSLFFDTIQVLHNLCYGDENGAITIENLTGGIFPITYSWSNGISSPLPGISSLPADMYSLHIEDANGCAIDVANIEVNEADSLYVFYTVSDDSCAGYSNGTISINISGGSNPYKLNGVLLSANDTTIANLPAGEYIYTILDANNCIRPQDTILVEEPDFLEIDTAVITHVLCHGHNTGAIDLTVVGGSPPYDYLWSPNGETTGDLIGLGEGTYSISILDFKLCPLFASYTITEPNTPITANLVIDSLILCNGGGGDINLTVNGGIPMYHFAWSNSDTTEDLSNVVAGSYSVIILDANGCDTTALITMIEPSAIIFTDSITDLACFEDGSGLIDITTVGGISPYSFLWDNGATTEDISNLMGGNYLLTVTDSNNCQHTENFLIQQPDLFETDFIVPNHIDCFDADNGSIDFQVTGGTAPINITYLWNTGITTSSLQDLGPGIYTVIAKDGNDCQVNDTIEIFEPIQIIITGNITNSICYGEDLGSIDITASGGVGGFTYLWDNGINNQDLFNAGSGSYQVIVTDANGCDQSEGFFIDQPTPFLETVTVNPINSCNGDATGSIDFSIVGNTAPYSYQWSNNQTSASIVNLLAGNYDIIVSDINNCEITYSYLITEPEILVLEYSVKPASCEEKNDGEIYALVTGGISPISYDWSNGEEGQDILGLSKGVYALQIEDANGCTLPLESIEVGFDGFEGCIEIPSGFTPNGDNIHDEWRIYGLYYFSDVVVKVYNRWGQEIYSSTGYEIPWDGKYQGVDLPTATYYYIIQFTELDKVFNGTVTIKR